MKMWTDLLRVAAAHASDVIAVLALVASAVSLWISVRTQKVSIHFELVDRVEAAYYLLHRNLLNAAAVMEDINQRRDHLAVGRGAGGEMVIYGVRRLGGELYTRPILAKSFRLRGPLIAADEAVGKAIEAVQDVVEACKAGSWPESFDEAWRLCEVAMLQLTPLAEGVERERSRTGHL